MAKMNFKEPYGTITGHDIARYQQNGKLFKADGHPVSEEELTKPNPASSEKPSAAQFLVTFLGQGARPKMQVFREAETVGVSADEVMAEFRRMEGKAFPIKGELMWKLPEMTPQ